MRLMMGYRIFSFIKIRIGADMAEAVHIGIKSLYGIA